MSHWSESSSPGPFPGSGNEVGSGYDSGVVSYVGWFSPFSEGFSPGSPVFLPSQKPTPPNSNSIRIEELHEKKVIARRLSTNFSFST